MLKKPNENYYNSMKKDIKTIKWNQLEIKDIISDINNILEGVKSRLDEAEIWINNLQDKVEKYLQSEQ